MIASSVGDNETCHRIKLLAIIGIATYAFGDSPDAVELRNRVICTLSACIDAIWFEPTNRVEKKLRGKALTKVAKS